jgi:hypothetical protein
MTGEVRARVSSGHRPAASLWMISHRLWRRGWMEPSNGWNSPGPCRMIACVRAAADSWAAPASQAVMRRKPNPPCCSGRASWSSSGEPAARGRCMTEYAASRSAFSSRPTWSWRRGHDTVRERWSMRGWREERRTRNRSCVVRGRARRASMRLQVRSVCSARKGVMKAGVPSGEPQAIMPALAWPMPSSYANSSAATVSCPYTLHLGSCMWRPMVAAKSHREWKAAAACRGGPVSGDGAAGSALGASEGQGKTPACHTGRPGVPRSARGGVR